MKNKKILIYLSSISFLIISFFVIYQYSIHVSTRDEAIEKYLSTSFDHDSSELIHVVETDIPNTYYLLLRTNGSDIINTTANVKIQNNIFGWKVEMGYEEANADFEKYLIDRETNTLN